MAYSLTIAIPAYNEEQSIDEVILDAIHAASRYTKHYEILLVDDGSTDTTGSIIDAIAKTDSRVIVVHHESNLGFSGAIKTCYKRASKDLIFLLPGDNQVHASDAALFLAKADTADVVVGYRITNPEPLFRKINSHVFHTLYRFLFGVQLQEISTSILWHKKVIDSINITALERSALIEPEVVYKAWKAGWKFAEVPIPYYRRVGDKPKGANPLMILVTLRELIRLWWGTIGKGVGIKYRV